MMQAQSRNPCLQVTMQLGGFLLAEQRLDRLQEVLRKRAPRWSAGLHVFRYPRERRPVDVSAPGALEATVRAAATERGLLYRELASRYGDPAARVLGSAEIRGSDSCLGVVVGLDEYTIRPSGEEWLWGNWLSLGVNRTKVDGVEAVTWASGALDTLCGSLGPCHAHAEVLNEYDAKNMSHEGGGLRAVGLDVSKALPGIYWLNFFGRPYRELIGRERLLSAPAHEVREVDDGVLLMLHPDPHAWETPEYRAIERRVLDHLGPQYFFSKADPSRKTVAPPFELPPRPDPPLRESITVDLKDAE